MSITDQTPPDIDAPDADVRPRRRWRRDVLRAAAATVAVAGTVVVIDLALNDTDRTHATFDQPITRIDVDVSLNGGQADLGFAADPDHVRARTNGGDITARLPADAEPYRVDAGSSGGSTDVEIRTDPVSELVIDAHSNGGDVTVEYAG